MVQGTGTGTDIAYASTGTGIAVAGSGKVQGMGSGIVSSGMVGGVWQWPAYPPSLLTYHYPATQPHTLATMLVPKYRTTTQVQAQARRLAGY